MQIVQAGIGNTPYAPVSAVLGAASYLFKACESVTKAYDGVEELLEQISQVTVRLKEYEFDENEASLRSKLIDILAYILTIIGKSEEFFRRRRFKQWARSVFLQDEGIQELLSKLKQYVESELGLVIALTYGRVRDLQDLVDVIVSNQRST